MTSRGERGEVRHHPAGHQGEGDALGESEHGRQLAPHDLFARGRCRRRRRQRRVLIPRSGEVVGGERGVEVPADHEPEVPSTRHALEPRRCPPGEIVDHLCCVPPLLGNVALECDDHPLVAVGCGDGALVERLEEVGGVIRRVVQEPAEVGHLSQV